MKMSLDSMVFYSIDNSPKTIKNGAYVINPDEYPDVGTH